MAAPEELSGTHGTYTMYRLERKLFRASCARCKAANTEMTTRFRRARGIKPRVKPEAAAATTPPSAKATGETVEVAKRRAAGTAGQQRARARAQASGDVKPLRKQA